MAFKTLVSLINCCFGRRPYILNTKFFSLGFSWNFTHINYFKSLVDLDVANFLLTAFLLLSRWFLIVDDDFVFRHGQFVARWSAPACFLVRWIIFHCNIHCIKHPCYFFCDGKNHLKIVRNCWSNIYFPYCSVASNCQMVFAVFMSRTFCKFLLFFWSLDLKMHFSAFGFSHWLSKNGFCLFFVTRSERHGLPKLIFHYKVFMKWVCLHPSMGL